MLFRFRYPWPLAHPQYFSSLVLRKWDKLRCLHLANGVMGYRHDTLGHALTTGTLKHLVTLQIAPDDCFDPSYLDSDEYRWRTPLLENLTIDLCKPQAVKRRTLKKRKFFVNLPNLRRLSLVFWKEFHGEAITEDVPESVFELRLVWENHAGRLPLVLQPGLQRLSLEGEFGDLNLRNRQETLGSLDSKLTTNTIDQSH
jgi:hypothetical protein